MLYDLPEILNVVYNSFVNKVSPYSKGFKYCMELTKTHFSKHSDQFNLHLKIKELEKELEFVEHDKKILEKRNKVLNEKIELLESDINSGNKKVIKKHFATEILGISKKKLDSDVKLAEIQIKCESWLK